MKENAGLDVKAKAWGYIMRNFVLSNVGLIFLACTMSLGCKLTLADVVFNNSGFEDPGNNASDSDQWLEDGIASSRGTSNPRTGSAAHFLGGFVSAGLGNGSIEQNTLSVGQPTLTPGNWVVAEFWAEADIEPGASANYQLEIVNADGVAVDSTGLLPIASTGDVYALFDTSSTPLIVPEFDGGPNASYGARLTIRANHNGHPTIVSIGLWVDDVRLVSSVPEPGSAFFFVVLSCFYSTLRRRNI